jgi:hypothetical protein
VTKKIIHVLVSIEALTGYEPIALPLSYVTCLDMKQMILKRVLSFRRTAYVTKKIIHVLVSIEALTGYEPIALPLS